MFLVPPQEPNPPDSDHESENSDEEMDSPENHDQGPTISIAGFEKKLSAEC